MEQELKKWIKLSFQTNFKSVEEAEENKERLGIYDAEINLRVSEGGLANFLPRPLRAKLKRLDIRPGVRWEIKMVGEQAHYVFIPCEVMLKGLVGKQYMGWFKLAQECQKDFEKMLGYPVPYFFLSE